MSILETLNKNKLRITTGVIVGIIALSCVIMGGIPLMVLAVLFSFWCSKEWVQILNYKGFYPFLSVMLSINVIFALLATFNRFDLMAPVIAFGTIAAFFAVLFRGRQPYIANVATTIAGFIYCGWMPCHLIMMRQLGTDKADILTISQNQGLGFLVLMFFAILATDIGAYYCGSKFGKRPLCPVVSPKKTVEGAIGGGIFAIITAMIIGYFIHLEWYFSLVAGCLITVFAQLGDLSESLIKRDAGVKDSGNSLPGHGGFLDRVDSYMFSAPIAYYFFKHFVVDQSFLLEVSNFIKSIFN